MHSNVEKVVLYQIMYKTMILTNDKDLFMCYGMYVLAYGLLVLVHVIYP